MIWQEKAECLGQTSLFYPEDDDPERHAKIEKAKDICGMCPVREKCLEAGLKEKSGVWGGTTSQERIQIRRNLRRNGTSES